MINIRVKKGWLMIGKRNIEYFAISGLVSAYWFYYHEIYGSPLKTTSRGLNKKDRNITPLT